MTWLCFQTDYYKNLHTPTLRGFVKLPIRFELVRSKQRRKGVERNGSAHFSWAHTQYTMLRYFSLYYWWHFPASGCSAETAIATLKDVSSTALISSGTNKISFSCSVFSCYAVAIISTHTDSDHTHTQRVKDCQDYQHLILQSLVHSGRKLEDILEK